MTLLRMALRYALSRPLITGLNVAAVALGLFLVTAILLLHHASRETLHREAGLFDLIVGAKGSPLQLTLSSLYHLDIPTGNITKETADLIARDSRVARAIPIGLGDNYAGHRIVGTTQELFAFSPDKAGKPLLELQAGRTFTATFDAVLGAHVAKATGLRVGDRFSGTHGVVQVPGSALHDDFPYEVVGILKPTGTSFDRALYVPIEAVWKIHAYDEVAHQTLKGLPPVPPSEQVTALLVQMRMRALRLALAAEIAAETEALAAIPVMELGRFFRRVLAPARQSLLALAWLVVGVSALSVMATLIQASERRRRDIAILRCLGAHRQQLLVLLLSESLLLTACGTLLGALGGHVALGIAGWMLGQHSGFHVNAWTILPAEIFAWAILLCVGVLAGVIPGWLAMQRDPAKDL